MKYAATDTGILAVKYRAITDRSNNKPKVVHLLTTEHSNSAAMTAKKDKDGNDVMKPKCVLEYNRHMGGVDLVDQQLESVLAIRKSYKWWKKILFRLLLQSALSAHKLHQSAGSSRDFLFFLHDCITTMIAKAPRLSTTAGSGLDSVARLTGRDHFPSKREYDGEGRKRTSKKKKCRVCAARGLRTAKGSPVETTWVCGACPSIPGLCVEKGCFRQYHTMWDYSN